MTMLETIDSVLTFISVSETYRAVAVISFAAGALAGLAVAWILLTASTGR